MWVAFWPQEGRCSHVNVPYWLEVLRGDGVGEQYVKQIGPMKWCKGALAGCHYVVEDLPLLGQREPYYSSYTMSKLGWTIFWLCRQVWLSIEMFFFFVAHQPCPAVKKSGVPGDDHASSQYNEMRLCWRNWKALMNIQACLTAGLGWDQSLKNYSCCRHHVHSPKIGRYIPSNHITL